MFHLPKVKKVLPAQLIVSCCLILLTQSTVAQSPLAPLTVEKIMRDPKWIGTSPSNLQWSVNSDTLYFNWNPDQNISDSLYFITLRNHTPHKASTAIKQNIISGSSVNYNSNYTAGAYEKDGDIYYFNAKTNKLQRITNTVEPENNPDFSFSGKKIVYSSGQNLFSWDINTGEMQQLTNFKKGTKPLDKKEKGDAEEEWMKQDQLNYLQVLKERKEKKEAGKDYAEANKKPELMSIYTGSKNVYGLSSDATGRFVSYRYFERPQNTKNTIVPNYITESGYTEDINGRTKVGGTQGNAELFFYDREKDTVYNVITKDLPGVKDIPLYISDYKNAFSKAKKDSLAKLISFSVAKWAPNSSNAIFEITSADNKDRWIMLWQGIQNKFNVIDHQHDEAWIGGPGINSGTSGWLNDNTVYFQSENSGFSHLYTKNIVTDKSEQITKGNYEVQEAKLSRDKKYFYLTTNEAEPGEQQFYKLNIATGKQEKLTAMMGANNAELSPDEKNIAVLYSYATKPWELFLQKNDAGAKPEQITNMASTAEFRSYPWRDPEIIKFSARDGQMVYARLYKPANSKPGMSAVVFVHGAGYLQNAHKWWSSYFREYMFNNLLADNGYYVIDIDYRASAGYGSKWRTGIYRHMGGQDLDDQEDGIKYLEKNYGVDKNKIGMYGGSYGGFITLMAMFTKPDLVKAGAALRPVTDWTNYNHGYTANILNVPYMDSISYHQSSPIYFANGLKNHLLICHGMVDQNVHFQDVVKLTQRLIELHKDNWELAPYPMEDHGFVEPSSWTDEYKRIFKLFEENLK